MDGHIYSMEMTLKEAEEKYAGEIFFRINRKILLNKNLISGFVKGNIRGTYLVELDTDVTDKDGFFSEELLTVSEKRASHFIFWMQKRPS